MNLFDTVKQCSLALDEIKPAWPTLINIKTLNMQDSRFCILGQIYGKYYDGIGQIRQLVSHLDYFSALNSVAAAQYWVVEINNRLKLNDKQMTYEQAVAYCIRNNGKVCRENWSPAIYYYYDIKKEQMQIHAGSPNLADIDYKAIDWQVWKDNSILFADIKDGAKFKYKDRFYRKIANVELSGGVAANAIQCYDNNCAVWFRPTYQCFLS